MTSQLRDYNLAVAGRHAPSLEDAPSLANGDRLGQRLMRTGLVSSEQLRRALALQQSSGIRLGQALLSLDFISPHDLAVELARQHRLPFFQLKGVPLDATAITLLPEELCRRHGLLPLTATDKTATIATSDPTDIEGINAARAFVDCDVRLVVSTATDVEDALSEFYEERYNDLSTFEFVRRRADESAYRTLGVMQRAGALVLVSALGVAALLLQLQLVAVLVAATVSLLVVGDVSRLVAVMWPRRTIPPVRAGLLDKELPVLTILAPLGSGRDVDHALASISRIGYPPSNLDIKLLIPADSPCKRELPFNATAVPVPESDKFLGLVLNYGLVKARGEIVTVFSRCGARHPEEARLAAGALLGARQDQVDVAISPPPTAGTGAGGFARLRALGQFAEWTLGSAIGAVSFAAGGAYFRTSTMRGLGGWDPFDPNPQANLALRLREAGVRAGLLPAPTRQGRDMGATEVRRNICRYAEARVRLWLVHTRGSGHHALLTSWLLALPWLQAITWLLLPIAGGLALAGLLPAWVIPLAVVGLALDLGLNLLVAVALMIRARIVPTAQVWLLALPYAALALAGHVAALRRLMLGNPQRAWPEAHPRTQAERTAAPSMVELMALEAAEAAGPRAGS